MDFFDFSSGTASIKSIFSILYTAIFLSVLAMILIGAINLIFPVSAQSLNNAKDKIQRAVYGGIATILLVPLINWFAPGLLNLGWLSGGIDGGSATSTPPGSREQAQGPATAAGGATGSQEETMRRILEKETADRQTLAAAGVQINRGPCQTPSQRGCTNVGGLPSETLSMLSQLKNDCRCTLIVTGGTEFGHTTHGFGKNAVDLRHSGEGAELTRFIQNKPRAESRYKWSICRDVYSYGGFVFCMEMQGGVDHHWHVHKP